MRQSTPSRPMSGHGQRYGHEIPVGYRRAMASDRPEGTFYPARRIEDDPPDPGPKKDDAPAPAPESEQPGMRPAHDGTPPPPQAAKVKPSPGDEGDSEFRKLLERQLAQYDD